MESYENPLDFVRQCIGARLTVRLRNRATLRGELVGYDDHLNMMVKDATLRRGDRAEEKQLVYLRGDMIAMVGRE